MKKAMPRMTPGRILWRIIDSEMKAQSITQKRLAEMASVNKCTVSEDSRDPERMPLHRVWVYFAALGIDPAEILLPIGEAHLQRLLGQWEVR